MGTFKKFTGRHKPVDSSGSQTSVTFAEKSEDKKSSPIGDALFLHFQKYNPEFLEDDSYFSKEELAEMGIK